MSPAPYIAPFRGLIRAGILAATIAFAGGVALGLTQLKREKPVTAFVTIDSSAALKVRAGSKAVAPIKFRVADGLHVNSNRPDSSLLIPTSLTLQAPAGIKLGKLLYPAGKSFTLEFAPEEKLSVYSGEVIIQAPFVVSRKVKKGEYELTGELTYQACDNHSCYPPKKASVKVPVVVR